MTTLAAAPNRLRLADRVHSAAQVAYIRVALVMLAFLLLTLLLIGRLATFALFDHQPAFAYASGQYVPERADIVDRNGVPLARTIPAYSIWVRPKELIEDPKWLADELAKIFPDLDRAEIYGKLTAERPGYLKLRALPEEIKRVHALGEIGIEFPREPERLYPEHELAAHLLGFTNRDGVGRMGAERALEERLTDPSLRAEPVALSIDSRVQGALRTELQRGMTLNDAKAAAGIVLDVESGEVLAMSSLPSFNPNKLTAQDRDRQVNFVTNQVYELGSTFKPLTIAAALDAGTVKNLAVRYDATEPLNVGGFKISDDHPSRRWLNVPETLVHSSNIVTARIADNLGRKPMEDMFRKLEFDRRPSIELGEAAQPLWPQNWGRVTNMTVAYGHGISVTPLHLASAYAALVNGGIWRPATIYKREEVTPPKGRRVFTAATSARMTQLLRMIVKSGTGRKADAPGFRIGGKTGSAEVARGGGYDKTMVVSTFAGVFPMDKPRYVVLIMMDEPRGRAETGFQRTAGWTAAPVVARLVPRIGPMLGVYPDDDVDVDTSELTPLLWKGGEE